MGSTLYWRPIAEARPLPDELKRAIEARYQNPTKMEMNGGHTEFLLGLIAARVPGAKELADAVEKHGEIEIQISW